MPFNSVVIIFDLHLLFIHLTRHLCKHRLDNFFILQFFHFHTTLLQFVQSRTNRKLMDFSCQQK